MSDILEHYGVKGMKWGVRRSRAQIDADSEDAAAAKVVKQKIARNRGSTGPLSNEELRKFNERVQLEQNYKNLMAKESQSRNSKLQNGAAWTSKFVSEVATQQAKNVANQYAKKQIEDNFGHKLKSKEQLAKEAKKKAKEEKNK